MAKQTLINTTDEPIVIPPKSSIDIAGNRETKKIMAQRKKIFEITDSEIPASENHG